MKVCENVYQIKIDFYVTKEIKRFVYVYLITGKDCYLIDSGVAGCSKQIETYMKELGRNITEIKCVFLTHAHPDHIGGAAEIKKLTGCKIYASGIERSWIEDIDVQFKERPIPNFYTLVNASVNINQTVKESDTIHLESGLSIDVLETAGHSFDSVSYMLREENVLFSGDAIPAYNDIPIFVDVKASENTLEKIRNQKPIKFCCPAWDRIYDGNEIEEILKNRLLFLKNMKEVVQKIEKEYSGENREKKEDIICGILNLDELRGNPLFKISIEACKNSMK